MVRIKAEGKAETYIFKCSNCGAEVGASKQAASEQK